MQDNGTLYLVDALGPFFAGHPGRLLNWSKIPFAALEQGRAGLDPQRCAQCEELYLRFLDQVAALGFNGITLDDLAHLTPDARYPEPLTRKIEAYRAWYERLIEAARRRRLRVFITTDVVWSHPALEQGARRPDAAAAAARLTRAAHRLFADFPGVSGLVARLGEEDAPDAGTDFPSRLTIRTAAQARDLLAAWLPIFRAFGKLLILRTWTVGAHPIGDLIWNRDTYDRVFGEEAPPELIVSMKTGETDFFRYLPVNPLLFRGPQRKLLEIQARREYEGCGEYPSFIGWEVERVLRELRGRVQLAGYWIWCQTGGWTPFRRLSFCPGGSPWNELNTRVALRLCREGGGVETAVRAAALAVLPGQDWVRLLELLRLSDEVIRELLYIEEFAARKVFFRRLRVPPLLAVYWDTILITQALRQFLRCFVADGERCIRRGWTAWEKIGAMRALAAELGLPVRDFDFQADTFRLLALAREYYFRPLDAERIAALRLAVRAYRLRWPGGYSALMDFQPLRLRSRHLRWLLQALLRGQRGYRPLLDRVFTVRLLAWLYPWYARWLRPLATDQSPTQRAMGLETVLR